MSIVTAARVTFLVPLALLASSGLAACGSDDAPSASGASAAPSSVSPSVSTGETPFGVPGSGTFGPGCSAVPTVGDGSFAGMVSVPVATAAAATPPLRSLTAALTKAGLGESLDSARELTVLAPTDDAFAKLPTPELNALLADTTLLRRVLEHHVIEGRLAPGELAGKHETLAGDTLDVAGSGEDFTVVNDDATVLCGNVQTSNATVYVIDTVLMPSAGGA